MTPTTDLILPSPDEIVRRLGRRVANRKYVRARRAHTPDTHAAWIRALVGRKGTLTRGAVMTHLRLTAPLMDAALARGLRPRRTWFRVETGPAHANGSGRLTTWISPRT